jgi:hypothetical protein
MNISKLHFKKKVTKFVLIFTGVSIFFVPGILMWTRSEPNYNHVLTWLGIGCIVFSVAFNPLGLDKPKEGFKVNRMPLMAKIFLYAGLILAIIPSVWGKF